LNERVIREHESGVIIDIKVHPGSSRKGLLYREGESLSVYVHSAPEKGKANKEAIKLLSKELGVPSSQLEMVKGERSRHKTILIKDISRKEIMKRLNR
jgi:uncharacterized protein (TIGR00251 family)